MLPFGLHCSSSPGTEMSITEVDRRPIGISSAHKDPREKKEPEKLRQAAISVSNQNAKLFFRSFRDFHGNLDAAIRSMNEIFMLFSEEARRLPFQAARKRAEKAKGNGERISLRKIQGN
jgi:hypothetical protein